MGDINYINLYSEFNIGINKRSYLDAFVKVKLIQTMETARTNIVWEDYQIEYQLSKFKTYMLKIRVLFGLKFPSVAFHGFEGRDHIIKLIQNKEILYIERNVSK